MYMSLHQPTLWLLPFDFPQSIRGRAALQTLVLPGLTGTLYATPDLVGWYGNQLNTCAVVRVQMGSPEPNEEVSEPAQGCDKLSPDRTTCSVANSLSSDTCSSGDFKLSADN